MSDVKPQGILPLIGNLFKNSTGFQNAHIIGQAFSTRFTGNWFSVVMGQRIAGRHYPRQATGS